VWALTNIASTDFTKMVVDAGAVPNLVTLLSSPSAEIRDQAAWCLGNIAGVCPALRVGALTAGALGPLIQNIMAPATPLLLNNSVWALSNFCRGKAAPELGLISSAICNSSACVVLRNNVDDVKVDALWALYYISNSDESSIVNLALRIVGNMVSGKDEQRLGCEDAYVASVF
jgi:importin subunit alpha-1